MQGLSLSSFTQNFLGHAPGNVAGAHANVGHVVACLELKAIDHLRGAFLAFALGALQPPGAAMAHYMGNFAPHVKFANALDIGSLELLVERLGRRSGLGFFCRG